MMVVDQACLRLRKVIGLVERWMAPDLEARREVLEWMNEHSASLTERDLIGRALSRSKLERTGKDIAEIILEAREWDDIRIVSAMSALRKLLESRSGQTGDSSAPATPPRSAGRSRGAGSGKGG